MIIKEIKKQKTKYLLVFENDHTLEVCEDSIVKHRLRPMLDVSLMMDDLKEELKFDEFYKKVIRFASFGKSSFQIRDYCETHGVFETDMIVERLKKEHYIDDLKLLRRLQGQSYSKPELEYHLKRYLFPPDSISHVLSIYDEEKALRKSLDKLRIKYQKDPKKYEKIYRNLKSKGFNESLIQSMLNLE